MNIRLLIAQLIEEKGISINRLSKESGVRRQSISHFLEGGNLHLKNLGKILRVFDSELTIKKITFGGKSLTYLSKRIGTSKKVIEKFCKNNGISYLAFFGSVLRSDFKKESDIDVLIELERSVSIFEFLEIEDRLRKLLKSSHRIDLLTTASFLPSVKRDIQDNCEVMYNAK